MPTYDYRCSDCRKNFSVTMTFSEYGKTKVVCPKCGSKKVQRQMSSFTAVTSKKS